MDQGFLQLPLYLNIIIVLASLFLLVKAGEYMVEGAVAFAEKAHISPLIIGSTIVAMGTSLAELAVNLVVTLSNGNTDVILGNIMGSNLVNIGLGLGIPAMITRLTLKTNVIEKELLLYFAVTAMLTGFAANGVLDKTEGVFFVLSFLVVLFLIYQYAMRERKTAQLEKEFPEPQKNVKQLSTSKILSYLVAGLVVLVLAAKLLVSSGSAVAHALGISDYVIGLTIIGIGTSFPEIVTSIQAARKGYTDIVLGNVFGSNIFNICFGLGLPMLVRNIHFSSSVFSNIYMINIYGLALIFILLLDGRIFGRNKTIGFIGGLSIVIFYLVYLGNTILFPA